MEASTCIIKDEHLDFILDFIPPDGRDTFKTRCYELPFVRKIELKFEKDPNRPHSNAFRIYLESDGVRNITDEQIRQGGGHLLSCFLHSINPSPSQCHSDIEKLFYKVECALVPYLVSTDTFIWINELMSVLFFAKILLARVS